MSKLTEIEKKLILAKGIFIGVVITAITMVLVIVLIEQYFN
ncbi:MULTISPECIES: hypothetical protein [Flavobacterium]|nr:MULTISPECIES: hypothetical protein [Flavobacterium]